MTGLVVGFVLADYVAGAAGLLPYALVFIVFAMGTSCTLESFRSVVTAPKGFLVALLVVFVCMPVIGYTVGRLLYPSNPDFAVGHFLISVTPVAITSMVWTGIAGGNIALSLSLVTVVTVLSGFNIPLQMSLFLGKIVQFDALALLVNLSRTIVVPVILGLVLRNRFPGRVEPMRPYIDLFTKLAMLLIISVNGAVVRPYIVAFDLAILRLFLIVALHTLLNFSIALIIARLLLGRTHPSLPPVVYAASMKNNAAGLVIALNYFGAMVALPVVISMMMQQFWAGAFFRIIRRMQGTSPGAAVSDSPEGRGRS